MAVTLTDAQTRFLMTGTRTGKIATVRDDGRPLVVPIWFVVDGDTLVFNTGATTVKALNMRRDPRATLCVDDQAPPYSYIMVEGTVTLSEDLEAMRPWATRIGGRYMGAEQAERFGRRNAVQGELLVRLTPTRVVFKENVSA